MSTSTLTNANLLINGGHRPRQSIIKSKTAHGSTMTITRSEKRCFIRYVNTIMNNAIQKAIEEKTKMQENGSWNFIMNTLSTTSTTEGDSANITSNGELTSPRGNNRRPRNVLLHLGDLAVIDYWKPMEVVGIEELESNVELFERLQDGVVFCHLLDKIQNGLVDWTKINKRNILTPLDEISKFQKVENQNFVLEVAPSVGCQIVGIGASELADGSQQPLLALLWQLIRQDVTKRLNVMHSLRLIALKEESESVVDFMKLPPQQLLLRFVNYNLKATKTKKIVANFSEDWKDGEAFCYLIKNIVDINNRFSSTKVSKNGNGDSGSDEEDSNSANNQKEFTEEQIQEILSIENHEERAKRIIQAINELGLNPNHVHIEGEDIATGVNTLIMTLVGSMFNATNLNGLQSELTEDPEKMTQLRREILDNFLEMMKDDMPEIKKPEMKVFLELVKKLSDVNIKEIEEKIVEQRVQEYKMEVRKLKKQHYVLFNQSEQYKRRIEELEKIVADQKVTIKDLEDKNAQQASRIQELEEELQKANHSRKEDLKKLGGEDFLDDSEDITAEEIRKKTSQKIEELVKRVKVLKEALVQTRKDLNYGMTLSGIDAETKLAEFRFGSPLTCDRLMSEHKPTLTGYLEKKGRLKKNWKKRFFVLLQNYLFYFAKENGKLKGFLRIEECEIEREEEVGSKGLYVFHIKTMGRLLSLRVDNVEDREDWIKWIYENSRVLHE